MNGEFGVFNDILELAESLSRPGEILGGQTVKFPLLEERFITVFIKEDSFFRNHDKPSFLQTILQKEFPDIILCVRTRDEKSPHEEQPKHLSFIASGGAIYTIGP